MTVLYIADFLYFIDGGAHVSACAHRNTLINMFGSENVKIIALTGPKDTTGEFDENLAIPGEQKKIKQFLNCLCGYTTYLDKKGIRKILEFISKNSFDIIFLDNSIYGMLVRAIKNKCPQIPIITYYHDVKASLAMQWKKDAPLYKKVVYQAMITNENINQQYSDVNLVLNPREINLFKNAYGREPEMMLGVYMDVSLSDKYMCVKESMSDPLKLLFVGSHYLPNAKGIKWFIEKVLPQIKESVKLTVVGSKMELLKDEIKIIPDGVTILGHVDDLSSFYEAADVIISPIFEGGGMKVKVAHAAAYGKVIIGTDESFEGYQENIDEDQWNQYFYRCNSDTDFIEAIENVRYNRSLMKYNIEIRDFFEKYYSELYAQGAIQKAMDIATEKTRGRQYGC